MLPASAGVRHETERRTDAHKCRNQGQRLRPTTCDACSLATRKPLTFSVSGLRIDRTTQALPPLLCSPASPLPRLACRRPPNHPTPLAKTTNVGESEMRNLSKESEPLNNPDTTHHCLRERSGTASCEAPVLREFARAGAKRARA